MSPTAVPNDQFKYSTTEDINSVQTPTSTSEKKIRLRKACDTCNSRKVKCDDQEPSCHECLKHGIECTRNRESKQRGPANKNIQEVKVQQAHKRKRQDDPNIYSDTASPDVSSTTMLPANTSLYREPRLLDVCPLSVLEHLVDDFFTYIYPLVPLPHEPSFYAEFRNTARFSDPAFEALTASMVAVLVASFPRRPRQHLKSEGLEHLFPKSSDFVNSCHRVSAGARGTGYLDQPLNVHTGITSYLLGLSGAYTHQWIRSRLYFAEALSIARILGAESVEDPSFATATNGVKPSIDGVDLIQRELGRRLWWVIFVGARSLNQLGGNFHEIMIGPPNRSSPYPPYPVEVDDQYIERDSIHGQPIGVTSRLSGYNFGLKVYESMTPIRAWASIYGTHTVFDWDQQRKDIASCIRRVKSIFETLPTELKLSPGKEPGQFEATRAIRHDISGSDDLARRELQHEIQKANLYASQLGTRSYLVEMYGNMREQVLQRTGANESSNTLDELDRSIAGERETIVKDLLRALNSISRLNMEPSSINKIRQVASTLIESPNSRKGGVARHAEKYLSQFLKLIMQLEHLDASNPEDVDLVYWSDIRKYQMELVQSGGFLLS
ncbi:hypothetical protein BJ878DRAFT_546840 [Calycina marina]|uniref:Zn(2)-C6 fungal-type domain-containing protein n=1 Tax=Calycina marina TaxID=1763456 RepID=A0A9P8CAV1_9HELO|nr:hypothetical protein BJ878DRAFT_546840 [Calycina marina]